MRFSATALIAAMVLFAAGPLQAIKVDPITAICLALPSLCTGPDVDPAPPIPDPPGAIGSDASVQAPVYDVRDDKLPKYEFGAPADPALHAFSMIADSRTHLAHASFPTTDDRSLGGTLTPYDFGHWDQWKLLGQFRTDSNCSGGRVGIHNAALAGTKAVDWVKYGLALWGPGLSNRVVVMVGGNDVIDRKMEYEWKVFLPIVGDMIRRKTTSDIHSYVKQVVVALSLSGREVIVQRHFMSNPGKSQYAVDMGLNDLNDYAYKDFGPDVFQIIPARFELQWKFRWIKVRIGHCPLCVSVPIWGPAPTWVLKAPKVILVPKIGGVTFAQIRKTFTAAHFLDHDYKHLNWMGYQSHAADLKWALWERCWW